MSANATQKSKGPAPSAAANAPPVPDERDAVIARLQRELAEERQAVSALRETSEQARFQLQILEKSYAKQLGDARTRADTAERDLAEKKARLAALDSGEDTTKLLKEARAELAQVSAERDELREQIARGGSYKPERARRIEPQAVDDGGTINALMTDSSWIRERKAAAEGRLEAKVSVEDDSPSVDLLDPSLVFTKGKRDDDEE
jgi:chromosome segregation ATPase